MVSCVEVMGYSSAFTKLLGVQIKATLGKELMGTPAVDDQGRWAGGGATGLAALLAITYWTLFGVFLYHVGHMQNVHGALHW